MLNNLFESICVTSAVQADNMLYICTPPYIKMYTIGSFQECGSYQVNAKCIYHVANSLALLLENDLKFVKYDFTTIATYSLKQCGKSKQNSMMPQSQQLLTIYNYHTFLLIEYETEYQICEPNNLHELQRKNNIVSFAPNPYNKIVFVEKHQLLENNVVYYDNKKMAIEMGVEQIFLASKTKPIYIYQSEVLPQLTLFDLEHKQEIAHIDFNFQLDFIHVFSEYSLIQSDQKIFKLQNGEICRFDLIQMKTSCALEMGSYKFIGSLHDNSIIFQDSGIVKQFYNLGQIIDIHPNSQICYIVSTQKQYPISLFRKGITECIISKIRVNASKPKAVFFISQSHALIQYHDKSISYQLPQFIQNNIGLDCNDQTIMIAVEMDLIIQVTSRSILLIHNGIQILKHVVQETIREAKYSQTCLYTYTKGSIDKYQIDIGTNKSIILEQSYQCDMVSTLEIVQNSLIYGKWFDQYLYTLTSSYQISQVSSTIISIQQLLNSILLGLNDGNIIVLNLQFQYQQTINISTSHPVKLIKYLNKLVVQSNQMYLLSNDFKLDIVIMQQPLFQLYSLAVYENQILGILNDEIQLLTFSSASSNQCYELKNFKNKNVLQVRFYKDRLILLIQDEQYFIQSYYNTTLRNFVKLDMIPSKLELFDQLYLVGWNKEGMGIVKIFDEQLVQLKHYEIAEPIYDIKVLDNDNIYVSTNTAIQQITGQFYYDFRIPILGFDIRDNYYIVYEEVKGAHLFYFDDRMIAIGSLNYPCMYATFYYENIIGFSDNTVRIAKSNSQTLGINDQLEIVTSEYINATVVKDQYYGTMWGQLGYFE